MVENDLNKLNYGEYEDKIKMKLGKKRAIMSDEEIEEAERFLMWYRRSYSDKEQLNLTHKWEVIQEYWEGFDDEEDPNTNIVNSNIEGKTNLLSEQEIGVQIDPREPGDKPFVDELRVLADFIKDKNKMYRKVDVHERRREMTGTGVFRVLWNFDSLDGYGMPEILPIHPSKIFVDTSITDVYDIQSAKYIIEAESKSIYSAELDYGKELADLIIENLDPVENIIKVNEEPQYVLLKVWTRYKDDKGKLKLRLTEMSGDGLILKDTKKGLKKRKDKGEAEIELFPDETYPYFLTPDMYREGSVWGKSSAELLLSTSDVIDEIDRAILQNINLTGNPIMVAAQSSGLDIDKITNEPGKVLPVNDINGVKWLIPPSIPAYIIEKRSQLMNEDRQVVTRFSDQMIGKQQKGVDTATESLALQNSGNSMIEHMKGLLQETLSEVFEYAIKLAIQNWDTTMLFKVTGKNGETTFESFNPNELERIPVLIESDSEYREGYRKENPNAKPEEYAFMQSGKGETRKVLFDCNITVGAGLPNNRAYRYNIVRQAYSDQAISKKEYRGYLVNQLGLNFQEFPETIEEQQEIGIYSETKEPNVTPNDINVGNGIPGINENGHTAPKEYREYLEQVPMKGEK